MLVSDVVYVASLYLRCPVSYLPRQMKHYMMLRSTSSAPDQCTFLLLPQKLVLQMWDLIICIISFNI